MKVGFTGTRQGMTDVQCARLELALKELGATEFHHGDCIGADFQAALIVQGMEGIKIVCHPPENPKFRANVPLRPGDTIFPTRHYIERNHDIVDACEHLLVAPLYNAETQRSGTWATYRYAVSRKLPITIIKR
ncbi:hypothetical protein LCGC14_2101720 [marine sediment metagenome]|uniref:DUF2493 domain-containing protein n=2 Tax=marine sediment metagenome TaxID=412755 RepID=A0A0F9GMZ1_9ZZZZ